MSRVLFLCKAESLTMYEQKSCAFATNLATDEASHGNRHGNVTWYMQ